MRRRAAAATNSSNNTHTPAGIITKIAEQAIRSFLLV
jgi:hypothetical protein